MNYTNNIQDFFNNLFTNFNSTDSMTILFILGISALLGLILGMILRGGAVRRWKQRYKAENQKYNALVVQHANHENTILLLSQELEERKTTMRAMEVNMKQYEKNQMTLQQNLKQAQIKIEQLNKENVLNSSQFTNSEKEIDELKLQSENYQTQIDQYSHQSREWEQKYKTLEAKIEQLSLENKHLEEERRQSELEIEKLMDGKGATIIPATANMETALSKIEMLENKVRLMENENESLRQTIETPISDNQDIVVQGDISGLRSQLNILLEENKGLKQQILGLKESTSNGNSTELDIQQIRARLAQLEKENNNLKTQLNTSNISAPSSVIVHGPSPYTSNTDASNEGNLIFDEEKLLDDTDAQQIELIKEQRKEFSAVGDRIDVPAATVRTYTKDDLTKIEGIGPFIEKKLNEIGIISYQQIGQFDDQEIERVTDAIQFFPGRIKRDNWVGQAQKLLS